MGRHPEPRLERLRVDWVYVGAEEASVLAGVSCSTIVRWIAKGWLTAAVEVTGPVGGRPRRLYRLDHVLALVKNNRR